MTIREIEYYSAVTTPAVSDEFLCHKNGITQKTTTTEILDAISDFTQYAKNDLIASGVVMGTQTADQVQISLTQIIAYVKSIVYGMLYGGYTPAGITKTCVSYNFAADSYTARTDLTTSTSILAASSIANKGYIYGGYTTGSVQTCEEYAFGAPGTWTAKTSFSSTARGHLSASTILGLGYIYAGYTLGSTTASVGLCDEYSPTANSWVVKEPLFQTRRQACASTILDKGYVFCGYAGGGILLSSCEQYNSLLNVWTNRSSILSPSRYSAASFAVLDKGYVTGGYATALLNDCDCYDAAADTWLSKTNLIQANKSHAATAILQYGYIFGGNGPSNRIAHEYNPITNSWKIKTAESTAIYDLASSTLHS